MAERVVASMAAIDSCKVLICLSRRSDNVRRLAIVSSWAVIGVGLVRDDGGLSLIVVMPVSGEVCMLARCLSRVR